MGSKTDPITMGILSLVCDKAIDTQLIPMLKTPATKVRFVQLKPADLKAFSPPSDLHAVILLHPFTEGRLFLTDVTDARYSKLLPILSSRFGCHGVCVIAYLIQNLKETTERTHLNMVKHKQPTVFEMASCVILCGNLEDMFQQNIQKIQEFIKVNWKNKRKSSWQDEWFGKALNEEDLVDKQIQNPKSGEEEIHEETRSAKDEDGEPGITSSSNKMEDETSESPPVVLVTDASGFIGSHIVQQLTQRGSKVRGALNLEKGTLDSFEKGTLDNVEIRGNVGRLKGLFPKLDLLEAGFLHDIGWKEAVKGCTHVIHTSRFHDNRSAREEDVTKLLEVCQLVGGIKRVVLTGGSDLISEEKLRFKEWMSINSALKDAICKYVSEKEALRFIQTEKPMFGLSIIKPPVVLGPILCELAEANVEIVRRRMVNASSGWSDISIPVCDVRDVAEAHIMALNFKDAGNIHVSDGVIPQRLKLKVMTGILEREFQDQGYEFCTWPLTPPWDSMAQCLSDLYGNVTKPDEQMASLVPVKHPNKTSVIDMAYSCIERSFIPKMSGYRPREQGRINKEETTGASV